LSNLRIATTARIRLALPRKLGGGKAISHSAVHSPGAVIAACICRAAAARVREAGIKVPGVVLVARAHRRRHARLAFPRARRLATVPVPGRLCCLCREHDRNQKPGGPGEGKRRGRELHREVFDLASGVCACLPLAVVGNGLLSALDYGLQAAGSLSCFDVY
jgi:hypothetical protein